MILLLARRNIVVHMLDISVVICVVVEDLRCNSSTNFLLLWLSVI